MGPYRFPEPRQCVYWSDPERVRGAWHEHFKLVEEYADESHLIGRLGKCRECGQLYFYEMFEWIDWKDGDDPQYRTYIPVNTAEEATVLARLTPYELVEISPALHINSPKGAATSVRWAGKKGEALMSAAHHRQRAALGWCGERHRRPRRRRRIRS